MCEEQHQLLELSKHEVEGFITGILEENLPETTPVDIEWIDWLIWAFQKKNQPFKNLMLLSSFPNCSVPSREDICRDVIKEGNVLLFLPLNTALVAVLRAVGVCTHTVAADYVASHARTVHAMTVVHIPKLNEDCHCCLEILGTKHVHGETLGQKWRKSYRTNVKKAKSAP